MLRRRQVIQVLLLLPLLLLSSGCPKDPYTAAIKASDDVANAVHAAITVATDYYGTGKLSDGEKAQVANYLNLVTDSNMKFRHDVVAAHTQGATVPAIYLQFAQAFVNSVPTDPLAFQYKSVDAQDKFKSVLGAVKTAINAISLMISGAK
jgi:hypothetical protein